MSTDRTVPFDAARVADDRARVRANVPAWQTALRHELSRARAARRRVLARLDATRRLSPPHEPGTAASWDRYVQAQVAAEVGEAVVASIGENLEQAQETLDHAARAPWPRRAARAGTTSETVLACLQRARELLLLIEDDDWVRAQLPTLRADVAMRLGRDDPRTEGYLRYLDELDRAWPMPGDQAGVQTAALRSPRSVGLRSSSTATATGSTLVAGPRVGPGVGPSEGPGVGPGVLQVITGSTQPSIPAPGGASAFAGVVPTPVAGKAPPATASGGLAAAAPLEPGHPRATTCPVLVREQLRGIQVAVHDARLTAQGAVRAYRSALLAVTFCASVVAVAVPLVVAVLVAEGTGLLTGVGEPPTNPGWALAGVQMWGMVGGALGGLWAVRGLRSSRRSWGLQVAQFALKLPAGALSAACGMLLLGSGAIIDVVPLTAQQLPAYAVLFGVAQQGLTRFVDATAGRLLDRAAPLGERSS